MKKLLKIYPPIQNKVNFLLMIDYNLIYLEIRSSTDPDTAATVR